MFVCLPGELLITRQASGVFFFEAELSNLADFPLMIDASTLQRPERVSVLSIGL